MISVKFQLRMPVCTATRSSLLLAGGSGPIYAFMAIVVLSGIVLLLLTFRGRDEALEATTYEDAEGVALPAGPEVATDDDVR